MRESKLTRFIYPTLISVWVLCLLWTYSNSLPRLYDDFKEIIFYIGGGLFVFVEILKKKTKFTFNLSWPGIFLLIYLIICLLSLSKPLYEGVLALDRILLWIGIAWFLSQQEKKTLLLVAKLTVLSASLIAIYSYVSLLILDDPLKIYFFNQNIIAPLGHISYYGDFMALQMPLALFLLFNEEKKAEKVLWILTLFLSILGLWMSSTRSAMVGFIAAFIIGIYFYGLIYPQIKMKVFIFAPLILVVYIGGLSLFHIPSFRPNIFQRVSDSFQMDNNSLSMKSLDEVSSNRWKGYLNTLDMIREKPILGWQLGSFRFNYYEFTGKRPGLTRPMTWYMHPHNELLNQAVEIGIPGMLVFILFWISLLFPALKYICNSSGEVKDRETLLVSLMGLVTFLAIWQFDTSFLNPLIRFMAGFYVALFFSSIRRDNFSIFKFNFNKNIVASLCLLPILSLGTYGASLVAVKHINLPSSIERPPIFWAKTAYHLAPGAFDPLFQYFTMSLYNHKDEQATELMSHLIRQYPYVPMVLYWNGVLDLKNHDIIEAKISFRHALRNAPDLDMAKNQLEQLAHY